MIVKQIKKKTQKQNGENARMNEHILKGPRRNKE